MRTIATRFAADMAEIDAFVDLLTATLDLAKQDPKGLRSKHAIATQALFVHGKARALVSRAVLFDGPYLTTCAYFELAVRELVEVFVSRLNRRSRTYSHLPKVIQEWHPLGNAEILLNLKRPQFGHLTAEAILKNLASCVVKSGASYQLTPEAFSNNERNFAPDILSDMFKKRLGLEKLWSKLARDAQLQAFLGSTTEALVEKLAWDRLDEAMKRRNSIIHRGRTYYTTSETEVRECSRYFAVLIAALAEVLENHLAAI